MVVLVVVVADIMLITKCVCQALGVLQVMLPFLDQVVDTLVAILEKMVAEVIPNRVLAVAVAQVWLPRELAVEQQEQPAADDEPGRDVGEQLRDPDRGRDQGQ